MRLGESLFDLTYLLLVIDIWQYFIYFFIITTKKYQNTNQKAKNAW